MKTATRNVSDLSPREMEFFQRALREDPTAAAEWKWEGFCNLGGRFGFWDVQNTRHPFQG
jgi:hypothetical protein